MEMLGLIILGVVLIAGVVLITVIKTPQLTSKKTIIDTVADAGDELFKYRLEANGLVGDYMSFLPNEASAIAARHAAIEKRKHTIEATLTQAERMLEPYQKVRAEQQFYDIAETTIQIHRHAITHINELANEARQLSPTLVQLYTLDKSAETSLYSAIGPEEYYTTANANTTQQLAATSRALQQIIESLNPNAFQTNEIRTIAESIATSLHQTKHHYDKLHELMALNQYDVYKDALYSAPHLLSRFDTTSYGDITSAYFREHPEDNSMRDLREYLFK